MEPERQMKAGKLLRQAAIQLSAVGCDAPRLDAELLLMHVWGLSRTQLIMQANDLVPADVREHFLRLLQRREAREPLAYILAYKEFWSRRFEVSADVLVPRPETEHLIEAVQVAYPDRSAAYRFCDIGTGSGCIAVTLACEYPQAGIVATDLSTAALSMARRNALQHGVEERITFRHGDMLAALHAEDGPFHAVVSNPPYVAESEMAVLEAELAMEPRTALTDGGDGLKFLNTILQQAPRQLQGGGYIIVETGLCGLPETPAGLCYEHPIHDLAGHLRGGVYRYP